MASTRIADDSNSVTNFSSDETQRLESENISSVQSQVSAIASHAVNVFLPLVMIWILLSMALYGSRKHKWKVNDEGKMYIACFITILSSLPRLLLGPLLYYLGNGIFIENCEIVADVGYSFGAIAISSAYLFLWYRQRLIYSNPYVLATHGKRMLVINWVLLFMMIVCYAGLLWAFIIPTDFIVQEDRCVLGNNSGSGLLLRQAILFVGSTLNQVIQLALFIYPMVKLKLTRRRLGMPGPDQSDEVCCIESTIRRSAISSAIAFVTDLATLMIISVIPTDQYLVVAGAIYGVDHLVNAFCALATFEDSWKILTILWRCKSAVPNHSREAKTSLESL